LTSSVSLGLAMAVEDADETDGKIINVRATHCPVFIDGLPVCWRACELLASSVKSLASSVSAVLCLSELLCLRSAIAATAV
jgi:hypothetical protein